MVWVLLILLSGTLGAQEHGFRYLGAAEGLKNLAIRRIYQDRAGFLWVSTEDGIFRYDGDRFEAFGPAQGIPQNSGASLGEAPDGSMLVGGMFGLYRQSGNHFERVPGPFKSIPWAQSIQSDGKGHTFVGTDVGLVELYADAARSDFAIRVLPQPKGSSEPGAFGIFFEGDTLWYGCGRELCRIDAHGTQVLSKESGLPGTSLIVVLKDSAGNLWVRAANNGIFELPAGRKKFLRPKLPIAADSAILAPSPDRAGRVLIASPQGLLIGDPKGWIQIDRASGLRGTVYSAFEDRQHSLWIGLAGRGLLQWRGYRVWESYSNESGLTSDVVFEILPREDGSIWVSTEAGLFRGERHPFGISFKGVAGMTGFSVHSLQKGPDGDLWIGTEARGVAQIDAVTGKPKWLGNANGLTERDAYTVRFDHEKRLWIATTAGIFMAQAPYRQFSRVAELPSTRFWAVTEGSDGTLWAGGASGLFHFTEGRWKTYTQADGLSNTEVLSLGAGPNGVVWVGYRFGGGIDRVRPQADTVTVEKGVQRNGTNGLVYFLDFDAKGRLWAGTERGVDIWDGLHWSHYDMNDGLAWDDCDLNAFAQEPDGTVWIGTSGGLSRFRPLTVYGSEVPLEVVFTRLSNGQADISGLRNPSFGSHDNSLVARFVALNAPRANAVVFRYRLVGANPSWSETTQRELHFANLAPGAYCLQIQARDDHGEWAGQSAEFPFRILVPWYSTGWFLSLCIFIPFSATAIGLRLRFLAARKRERELILLVEEKTIDLRRANEELSQLSFTDPLTGMANRRVFDRMLVQEFARVERNDSSLSILNIDADHFKGLNDSEGHLKGDEYLKLLGAELIRICHRKVDLAARCGGEEFFIVLPDMNANHARLFAESVREAIANLKLPYPASPVAPFLTVSIGVATATKGRFSSPKALIDASDQALYAAKRSGRNLVCEAPQPTTK